ncbi:MAG TPA: lytic transglycosylase domain-containing protein [Syntrophorhabdaceae bacterium]|nr:lytic transglycosylase domain-containing protein [Syntrophorhabdaceae bacterium]
MSQTARLRLFCFVVLIAICLIIPSHIVYTNIHKKAQITRRIIHHLKYENGIEEETARVISRTVYEESEYHKIDYRLILALMKIESNFKNDAVSSKGARGLLQVKPSVARYIADDVGVKWTGHKTLDKPDSNIKIGTHFFSMLLSDFKDVNAALKAYNMGPTRVRTLPSSGIRTQKGFSGLVLNEYKKNSSAFPEP